MLPLLCRFKFSSASHSVRARGALIATKDSVCDKIHHGKKGICTLNIFQMLSLRLVNLSTADSQDSGDSLDRDHATRTNIRDINCVV